MENRSVFKDCADPPKAKGTAAKLVEDEGEAQLEARGASCHEPERSSEETRSTQDEHESSSRRAGVILRHLETNSRTGVRTTGAHSQTMRAPCLLPLRTDEFRYPFSEGLCPDPQVLVIPVVWVFVTWDIYGRHWASLICRTPIDVHDVCKRGACNRDAPVRHERSIVTLPSELKVLLMKTRSPVTVSLLLVLFSATIPHYVLCMTTSHTQGWDMYSYSSYALPPSYFFALSGSC